MSTPPQVETGIAIVGMAGRFPKARNIAEFWRNLCDGVEAISRFTDAELEAAGVNFPKGDPSYVKARGILEEAEWFDAAFFGVNPREAEVMDPQHRVFLECAWEAMESAGYDAAKFDGAVGVFAGMSMNTYLANNLLGQPDFPTRIGEYQAMLGNDKDFLPTRVSYKLNLRGPSLNIQTACSTSLVAVCVACQNLLNYECDLALAGAVSVLFPQQRGYLFQPGGIASSDGHCRAFDAKASGTVGGEGVGIVVLKRLTDALAAGDTIYAVIKGFATNNDGAQKAGYTAPSVDGQAEVIATAQAMAGFPPETISYIEAHGTGTPLGDPIEIEGLTKAFRTATTAKNFCALGSAKSNIGHLDAASGVAGLIKCALALHEKKIPPSLHFESPNPKADFANSPFFVTSRLTEWQRGFAPLRAGVSSFGIGGTNAHVVLEETPPAGPSPETRKAQLLLLSAKTPTALDRMTANLAAHLKQHPSLNLADVAWTLQTGRHDFNHRRMLVCRDASEAVSALESPAHRQIITRTLDTEHPPVVFMFPGQGAQRVNMGRELYDHEPVFRKQVDRCCDVLTLHLGVDLRTALYPSEDKLGDAAQQLTQTALTQPALFVIEYALACLWMSWGVKPGAMIGHSIGEYVAACLSGVFSLDTALCLVAERGRLMQQMPAGTMLAVRLPEGELKSLLEHGLFLSAVNGTSMCVVSGSVEAIEAAQRELARRNVPCTLLRTSHAFHSAMMEPMLPEFTERVRSLPRSAPQIPFLSNVTGRWITADQATDPAYWANHVRQTVRFADGLGELFKVPERVLLEVGPGQTLCSLAKQHPAWKASSLALPSLPQSKDGPADGEAMLNTLGQLWLGGVRVDWRGLHAHEPRRRVRLPTYPFERKRFWIEPVRAGHAQAAAPAATETAGHEEKEPDATATSLSSSVPVSRKERIIAMLRTLLGDLSGLNLAEMKGHTTFAEMGFDSLFLTQASLAMERKLGVRVAFRQLLEEFSTLDALAGHIEKSSPTAFTETPAQVRPLAVPSAALAPEHAGGNGLRPEAHESGEDQPLTTPLTAAQRELWFAAQMSDAASCAYNESRLLHLRGPLQPEALFVALQQLVDRHEALRTTFAPAGDTQQIHPALKLEVRLVDWSKLEPDERTSRLDAAQLEEGWKPFDFVNGPLLRARLIRLGERHHALLLTVHHIVCDGRSFGILLRELSELYSTRCQGGRRPLAAPLQLSQYVRALSDRPVNGAPAKTDVDYWVEQFADGAPVLELPTDHPRPATWTFEGAHECRLLSVSLGEALKRVSAQHGTTLFTTLLATYYTLLHRLTGQAEIVVGIPTADRTMDGGDTLVGHCVNFLPLRARLRDGESFAERLAATQKLFLDAHEHQQCTFGSLIQKLNLPRDPGRMPLVSVTFNVERLGEALKFSGLDAELLPNVHGYTNFDLSFNVTEVNGALQLDCRYHTGLFSAATIQRWLGHYQTLLENLAVQPQQAVSALPLLSADERRQILEEWNETQATYPRDKCVHELFEEQVERTPDAVAAILREERLSYRALNEHADLLVERLRGLGVGPDGPVGICLERSFAMLASVLAVLKAGGAYVPLDPAYPPERLQLMLKNARVPLVLTQHSLRQNFPFETPDCQWLCVEELADTANRTPRTPGNTPPLRPPQATDLAYVIHTSGSTGVPKGVAIEHRSAVNFIHWAQSVFTQEELAGVLFSTSLCFDLSVFELFVTLASGGTVVIAQNALALPELPARNEVTLLNTVPSASTELLRLKALPPSVRVVNLAGEPLKPALVDRLYTLGTVRKVHDLYGPSETTTYSTYALRRPEAPATVGRPIANTQVFLLDAKRQPVPIGVVGEIFIGGDGLARGYLHQPELTAERFIPNPFSAAAGARLYRTGDLARWLPDGNLEFLGRSDHQVKIRGHRVELGEIESVLGRHPAVRECVVVAREDQPDEKRLAAYLVIEPDQADTTSGELRAFLQTKLPDHMMPSAFVFLEALPLTPNGKVDRRALPAPAQTRPEPEDSYAAPGTPTELALAEIWREILRLDRVGVHDNFFALGGHSLLATQMISRIRDAFQVELPMRRVFESPSIAALATVIETLLVEEIQELSEEEVQRFAHSA